MLMTEEEIWFLSRSIVFASARVILRFFFRMRRARRTYLCISVYRYMYRGFLMRFYEVGSYICIRVFLHFGETRDTLNSLLETFGFFLPSFF